MCLVLGRMAGALANVSAALLSSNILHLTVGLVPPTGTPLSLSSCTLERTEPIKLEGKKELLIKPPLLG
jgi:hypothetical protein